MIAVELVLLPRPVCSMYNVLVKLLMSKLVLPHYHYYFDNQWHTGEGIVVSSKEDGTIDGPIAGIFTCETKIPEPWTYTCSPRLQIIITFMP